MHTKPFYTVNIRYHVNKDYIMWYYITTEAPELLLDANMSRDHLAMIGTDITLSAVIKGMPPPTVTWKKDDGEKYREGGGGTRRLDGVE